MLSRDIFLIGATDVIASALLLLAFFLWVEVHASAVVRRRGFRRQFTVLWGAAVLSGITLTVAGFMIVLYSLFAR